MSRKASCGRQRAEDKVETQGARSVDKKGTIDLPVQVGGRHPYIYIYIHATVDAKTMWFHHTSTGGRKVYTKIPDMVLCKDDGNTAVFVGEGKTPWNHKLKYLELLFDTDRNDCDQKNVQVWLGKYLRIFSCAISC